MTTMEKKDLTGYGERELSLLVFNDESLYKMRRFPRNFFKIELQELFIFTDEQWEELENDLNEEKEEEE